MWPGEEVAQAGRAHEAICLGGWAGAPVCERETSPPPVSCEWTPNRVLEGLPVNWIVFLPGVLGGDLSMSEYEGLIGVGEGWIGQTFNR